MDNDRRLRIVVADDEPIALRGLEGWIGSDTSVNLVGSCRNGAEALEVIRDQRPDLAFLDVAMPSMSGLEVVRSLAPAARPAVVFVTAFDRFAIDAFDLHAVDYLLKPFDEDRFRVALARARARLGAPDGMRRLEELLANWDRHRGAANQLTIRDGDRILILRTNDIDWIEAEDNYVRIHTGEKRYLVRETMASLESRLARLHFVRIHRSTIVNVMRIVELRPGLHGEYQVLLGNGVRLTLSRSYRDGVIGRIGGDP